MATWGRASAGLALGFSHGTKATIPSGWCSCATSPCRHVPDHLTISTGLPRGLARPAVVRRRSPPRYRIPVMRDVAPNVAPGPEGLRDLGPEAT